MTYSTNGYEMESAYPIEVTTPEMGPTIDLTTQDPDPTAGVAAPEQADTIGALPADQVSALSPNGETPSFNTYMSLLKPYVAPLGSGAYGVAIDSGSGSGVAPGLLTGGRQNSETGGLFGDFLKWFDNSDTAKGAVVTVAGSFLQGMFGSKAKARAAAAQEKHADASMMNAQSNADMAKIAQQQMVNASSIKDVKFSSSKPKFKNVPLPSQSRAAYKGV